MQKMAAGSNLKFFQKLYLMPEEFLVCQSIHTPNLVKISHTMAKLLQFEDLQNGG